MRHWMNPTQTLVYPEATLHRIWPLALSATFVFACVFAIDTDVDPGPDASPPDLGAVDVPMDDASPEVGLNACGGEGTLRDERDRNVSADQIGDTCGLCGGGTLVCDGPAEVTCLGDTPNPCGGCEVLPGIPEQECGRCGGEWRCGEDGESMYCSELANPCGGCTDFSDEVHIHHACPLSDADDDRGIWSCTSSGAARCSPIGLNACGGDAALGNLPGEPCGACDQDVYVCTESGGVECDRDEDNPRGLNLCGGCGRFPFAPDESEDARPGGMVDVELGAPCGLGTKCGTWACVPGSEGTSVNQGRLWCAPPPEGWNACGGCADFGGKLPGDACDLDGARGPGVLLCAGPNALHCADSPATANACGGDEELPNSEEQVGDPCGDVSPGENCRDGVVVCASPNQRACLGATSENACGYCPPLAQVRGAACGLYSEWECDAQEQGPQADGLSCEHPSGNPCGGEDMIDTGQIWDACGRCEGQPGRLACAEGDDGLECVDLPMCP